MTKLFYLSEVIKFAVEKEKESVALYKSLRDKTTNEDAKELFSLLAHEEETHASFYTNILDATPKEQSAGVKEDEEYEAYMQELIRVSRSVLPLDLENLTDIKIALDYAVDREKDSVLFYVGLRNQLPLQNKEKINDIIREEARHMDQLLLLKKQLHTDS